MLYRNGDNTEDTKEVKSLLLGEHALSKYFSLNKFIVYNANKPVARFAITLYPKDHTAYFGFFESIDDEAVAKAVFDAAMNFANTHNCKRIVGPVNASFWLGYRLKINKFDEAPYTGEPYNKDYYQRMFEANGYKMCDHYTSNHYKPAHYAYMNKEYQGKYEEFMKKGYEIRDLELDKFDESLGSLYELIMVLYSDFPIFKKLSKEDFMAVFDSFRQVIDPKMVKLGYKDGKMVGFFVSVPNYGSDVYNITPAKLMRILKTRKHPQEYIMLYIGVDRAHHGLGRALVYSVIQELNKNKCPSIGALMHDGKVTQKYAKDMIDQTYEYALFAKEVK
jgi:hypothetical protein